MPDGLYEKPQQMRQTKIEAAELLYVNLYVIRNNDKQRGTTINNR